MIKFYYFKKMINCESREHMLKALYDPRAINIIAEDAFKVADKDRNGYIDKGEFELCVKNVSEFFGFLNTIRDITNEFDRLDADKNGILDFSEFKGYVKEIIEKILFI